ncbi:MAG: methyltransferase domain-containing protein [Legionellales bacterium]|nr:methyltransferase domain-containing protein [Legionellales bacterium]
MNKDSHSILEIVSKIRGNLELLNCTLNLKFDTVLDIGLGDGLASLFFAAENKKVVPIGINIDKYNYPKDLFKVLNINIIETSFSEYQTNNKYNAIWASHILEHVQNVGEFLEKCRNLLTDDGWLFVLVPPYKNTVVGGHVTTGWNIGQLLYNLLLTGYNIKTGHFIQYGYNICGFVQKSTEKLPALMMDKGDI